MADVFSDRFVARAPAPASRCRVPPRRAARIQTVRDAGKVHFPIRAQKNQRAPRGPSGGSKSVRRLVPEQSFTDPTVTKSRAAGRGPDGLPIYRAGEHYALRMAANPVVIGGETGQFSAPS